MDIQLQVGVKALLKNKEGKYLIIRRNPVKYPEAVYPVRSRPAEGTATAASGRLASNGAGRWDIVGGRITLGASLFENLQREIKEETNLDLIEEPRLVAAQDILRVPGRHVVRLTYVGVIDGWPKLDTEENVEYKWATLDEITALPEMDIYFKEVLEKKLI